jgi:hypothetical protein
VKVARIEIYAFMASRWFMVRGDANNAKFYKQKRLYCRTAMRRSGYYFSIMERK